VEENREFVEYSPSVDGNFIRNIYYEFETDKAVRFGRQEDEKFFWIPKSNIKGGWKKDKQYAQDIGVKFNMKLHWEESKFKIN